MNKEYIALVKCCEAPLSRYQTLSFNCLSKISLILTSTSIWRLFYLKKLEDKYFLTSTHITLADWWYCRIFLYLQSSAICPGLLHIKQYMVCASTFSILKMSLFQLEINFPLMFDFLPFSLIFFIIPLFKSLYSQYFTVNFFFGWCF